MSTAAKQAGAAAEPDAERRVRQALARGEERAAVGLLVRAYGPAVFRYCRTVIGNDADAEDLLQITFLQAQRSLASMPPEPALPAWLLGIARHRCLDKLRAERRRRWGDPEELEGVASDRVDQSGAVAGQQAARAIEQCLDRLEARARSVVVMRLQDHLSYDEIAAVTGERAATLRVKLSRALVLLRSCLEAKGVAL